MSGTPFRAHRAHRARRCSFGGGCQYGGRIRPGHWIIRHGHRRYVHVEDIVALMANVAEAARRAALATQRFAIHVQGVGSAMHAAMPGMVGQAVDAARLERVAAEARRLTGPVQTGEFRRSIW